MEQPLQPPPHSKILDLLLIIELYITILPFTTTVFLFSDLLISAGATSYQRVWFSLSLDSWRESMFGQLGLTDLLIGDKNSSGRTINSPALAMDIMWFVCCITILHVLV